MRYYGPSSRAIAEANGAQFLGAKLQVELDFILSLPFVPFTETFTDTENTELENHISDTGEQWVSCTIDHAPDAALTPDIKSNTAVYPYTGTSSHTARQLLPHSDEAPGRPSRIEINVSYNANMDLGFYVVFGFEQDGSNSTVQTSAGTVKPGFRVQEGYPQTYTRAQIYNSNSNNWAVGALVVSSAAVSDKTMIATYEDGVATSDCSAFNASLGNAVWTGSTLVPTLSNRSVGIGKAYTVQNGSVLTVDTMVVS